MAATVSISKGVFAFKKNKSKKNTSSKICISNYWRQEEGRDDPTVRKFTLQNYEKCWSSVNKVIENLLDKIHTQVFEDLVTYVKRVGLFESRIDASGNFMFNIGSDIPAACLVTGVNMPDHDSIFHNLTKSLKEQVTPHVARLSSAQCSNIKVALYKVIHTFINGGDDEDSVMLLPDSDEDDDALIGPLRSPRKRNNLKRSQCNMNTLSAWYKNTISIFESFQSPTKKIKRNSGFSSPRKSKLDSCKLQPLVVIVEDVEGVPSNVLQDLLLIFSEYRKSLPVVFILGVSTTPAAIHRYLSQDASTSVAMETFQAQPSSLLLSQIIEKVFMTSSLPFHVGGKVFKLLLDIFLYHDLSINNFVSGLKYCMLEHFLRGKASFLCCDKKDRITILKELPSSCLRDLRELPSCQKLIESLPESEKRQIEDDSQIKHYILSYLEDLDKWYDVFCLMVRVLHSLVHTLPGTPLGRQIRELYSACLSQQITDSAEFQDAWKFLTMSCREEILPKINDIIVILEGSKEIPVADSLLKKIHKYFHQLQHIDQLKPKTVSPTKPVVVELKPSDRFHLREKLLGSPKQKPKNPYEELRTEILSTFEHVFITYLKSPTSKPFHEILFFDLVGNVKYHLLGSLRATITTGLTNPHKYLQCNCCKLENPSDIVTSLPDLSLCYKLHLECGRLINLYDWLQAFVALIGEDHDDVKPPITNKKGKKPQKKKVNEEAQARFVQSVAELQLLGFIKPSKRKTDHVQRLIWGGC